MKRLLVITLILFGWAKYTPGQNLVTNPSFEDTTLCPDSPSQADRATGWSSFRDTPDYFNTCSPSSQVSVPLNNAGYQYAATGNAYCGIITNGPTTNYREFLGTTLSSPLLIGQKYYVSFKVCMASDMILSKAANNKTGIRFTTNSYSMAVPVPIDNFAHVYTDSVITDSVNWTTIAGSLIADSAYQYMAIGNFFNDLNTDTIGMNTFGGIYGYYLVDDICVKTDSTPCNFDVSITENKGYDITSIYPNPFREKTVIRYHLPETATEGVIMVFDLQGKLLKTFKLDERGDGEVEIDGGELYPGMFMYSLVVNGLEVATRKMILTD